MKDEIIKEILDSLKDILDEPKGLDEMPNGNLYEYDRSYDLEQDEIKVLLDYITNLQEENEELREDNFAYHQLMKMQNQREYRSKFLKDFQKEYGKNVFPDYDEIYKRYDDYKQRNEKAIEKLKYYSGGEADYYVPFEVIINLLQGKSDE